MTYGQKLSVFIGAIVISATVLFPPWTGSNSWENAGVFQKSVMTPTSGSIDVPSLSMILLAEVVVIGALLAVFAKRRDK